MELLLFNNQIYKKKGRADWGTGDGGFFGCACAGRRVWCLHLLTLSCALANRAREHQAAACMYVCMYIERIRGSKEEAGASIISI